jgi:hypothetical protein
MITNLAKQRGRLQDRGAQGSWIPPPQSRTKINTDAAVAKTAVRGAVGVVCRSEQGEYLGSSAVVFEGITHPGCLEAMACREPWTWPRISNLERFRLRPIVWRWFKGWLQRQNLGVFSHILCEIKERALARGETFFCHEKRDCNREAHSLARFASTLPAGRHVWLLAPPEGLNLLVNIDIA